MSVNDCDDGKIMIMMVFLVVMRMIFTEYDSDNKSIMMVMTQTVNYVNSTNGDINFDYVNGTSTVDNDDDGTCICKTLEFMPVSLNLSLVFVPCILF